MGRRSLVKEKISITFDVTDDFVKYASRLRQYKGSGYISSNWVSRLNDAGFLFKYGKENEEIVRDLTKDWIKTRGDKFKMSQQEKED